MNKMEATKIVEIIGSLYSSYKPMSLEVAVMAWQNIFADVPFKAVAAALYSYARNNNEFAPTPGQVNEIIKSAVNPDALNEERAWDMVRKAAENGLYGSEKEFDKLPEIVQRTIGSPHFIYSLAMLDATSLTVEKSMFMKSYRKEVEKQKHIDNLPSSVRNTIEQMRANAPTIENKQEAAMIEMRNHYEDAYARTVAKFHEGDREEEIETNRNKGFSDMLREKLGMTEPEADDDYAIEEYDYDEDEELFA